MNGNTRVSPEMVEGLAGTAAIAEQIASILADRRSTPTQKIEKGKAWA